MRRSRFRPPVDLGRSAFSGFRFPPEVIILAVRWYLRYGLSYRDLEEWHCCIKRNRLGSGQVVRPKRAKGQGMTALLRCRETWRDSVSLPACL
jgi:hypothetical protein